MSKLPDIICSAWEGREGPVVFTMEWVDPQYPRVAAALLKVQEVYSGSEKIL